MALRLPAEAAVLHQSSGNGDADVEGSADVEADDKPCAGMPSLLCLWDKLCATRAGNTLRTRNRAVSSLLLDDASGCCDVSAGRLRPVKLLLNVQLVHMAAIATSPPRGLSHSQRIKP